MADAMDLTKLAPQLAPSGAYMRLDDNLRITSYNSAAGVGLTIRSRILTTDGSIDASSDGQTPNTDRTAKQSILITPEGWLLGGQVFVSAGTPLVGQCYVVVEIFRGTTTSGIALQQLAAGYVTAKQPLAFPLPFWWSSIEGAGALRSIAGTTPGAGVEISETVPTGARWELLVFKATLTTSAAAANRLPALTIDDGTTEYYRDQLAANEPASTAYRNVWAQGLSLGSGLNTATQRGALPVGLRLGSGHRIKTVTAAIDAGDQWSAVQYVVREWIEGA